MKFRLHFLSIFVLFSLIDFNANADPCTSPITTCTNGSDAGLHCSETTASCDSFSSGYSTWNSNTCVPSRVYDSGDFQYYIQYTCGANMHLTSSPYQCVCDANYYMVNGSTYTSDPLTATGCNACSAAETNGRDCTCAGGTDAPACNFPITLNINSGTGTPGNTTNCTGTSCVCPDNGTACALPNSGVTAPSGYTFNGWNSAANGSGTVYGTSYIFNSGSMTIYAQWAANSITISYNANGGTGTASSTSCIYNGTCNLATASAGISRVGYTLVKWCKTAAGDVPAECYDPGSSKPQLAVNGTNLTLYAKWNPTTYNITYYTNFGTCPGGTCLPPTYNITSSVTLPIPTKSGNMFNGWYDNIGLNGTAVTTIPAGGPGGDKSFWAKWVSCPDNSLFIGGECKIPSGHKICGNNGCITVPSDIFYH